MTDLSSFSSNDFNASVWINTQLEDIPHGETVESLLTSLSMKLHLAAQEHSEQQETAMVESMATMPRIVAEIGRLEDQLQVIHHEMRNLSEHVNTVDNRGITGVEELSRLDALKTSMEKCKSTLEEHARWSQLVREARLLLESGGTLSETADRIETMFKSLEVLRELPGHEEREKSCISYRDALLGALLPALQSSFDPLDITRLEEYLYVFRKVNREEEFEKEYLLQRGQKVQLVENLSATSLAFFLGTIQQFLQEEESAILRLFGDKQRKAMMLKLLSKAMDKISSLLPLHLRLHDDVHALSDCATVLEEFTKRILPIVLGEESMSDEAVEDVAKQVLSPLSVLLPHFLECEERWLKQQLIFAIKMVSFNIQKEDSLGWDSGELGDDEEEDVVAQLEYFASSLLPALDAFFNALHQSLQRGRHYLSGQGMKGLNRGVVGSLQLAGKLFARRFALLRMAMAEPLDGTDSSLLNSTEAWEEGKEIEETLMRSAGKLALVLQTRGERGNAASLSVTVLRGLQAVGHLKGLLEETESLVGRFCQELLLDLFPAGTSSHSQLPSVVFTSYRLRTDGNFCAEMKAFLQSFPPPGSSGSIDNASSASNSLMSVGNVYRRLAAQAGQLLLSLALGPATKLLESYHLLDGIEEGSSGREGGRELSSLEEVLLPRLIVTQVGESLLSWVQHLEAFASSDALQDLLALRGAAAALSVQTAGWKTTAHSLDLKEERAASQIANRSLVMKSIQAYERELAQAALSLGLQTSFEEEVEEVEGLLESEDNVSGGQTVHFVNEWLASIADSVMGLYLARLLVADESSKTGLPVAARAQLSVDLDYLCNVVTATGIRCHALFPHLRKVIKESPSTTQKVLHSLATGKNLGALKDLLHVDLELSTILYGQLLNN
eukprot:gene8738-9631_t